MSEHHTIKVHIKNADKAINSLLQEPNRKVRIIIPRESLNRGGFTIHLTDRQYTFFNRKKVGDFMINADINTFGGNLSNIDSYYDFTQEDDLEITSSTDLEQMLDGVKGFIGVFANNDFPSTFIHRLATTTNTPLSAILNYDNSDQPGTHWVGLFIDPKVKHIEYFDPFGVPPKKRILNILNKLELPIIMSNTQLQDLNSEACGYYVVEYIKMRTEGMSMYDILFDKFTRDPIKNEKILKNMVKH